tara:strand:- start:130 stop:342 length:213 start_codon:yes stop_codon:yes gene_type:complete
MLQMLTDVQGVLVAAAVIYAAKELRRIANEVHSLNHRVGLLERMFERTGLQIDNGRESRTRRGNQGSNRG